MTETIILDKSGNTRVRIRRSPALRTGFSIGTETFADEMVALRATEDAVVQRQRCRAGLNLALLSQRPVHGGKSLPITQTPQDLHLIETLVSEPQVQFGKTEISLVVKSGRWDQDDIFARQPHSAWMRMVDYRIGSRRGSAAAALRDYWRLICLEMPHLGPGKEADVTVRMPKGVSGMPILIMDGVIFHAMQSSVADLTQMAVKQGARGFVSVGPAPARETGSLDLSLVALTAPSPEVFARCLQPLREESMI